MNRDESRQQFLMLLEKHQKGLLNERESALLEDWLETLGDAEIKTILSDNDKQEIKAGLLKKINEKEKAPVRKMYPWWQAAAAIAILSVASFFLWQNYMSTDKPAFLTIESTSSSINKTILSDGSIIWLKGNSSLTYPAEFSGDTRQVTLMGEALFEVAKNPQKPFIIQCGDLSARVLGTSFNIRSDLQSIDVTVLTGKVSLTSTNLQQELIVTAHEKASYDVEKQEMAKVESPEEEEVSSLILGTEYNMNFQGTRMQQIIEKMEGKFDVNITVTNPAIANCRITADLTDQSLEATLAMITGALGFTYENNNGNILLKGDGCDNN